MDEIYSCLTEEKKRIRKGDIQLVVKLLFETITQELLLGNSIIIRNFGRIEAQFKKGGELMWCEPVKRMVRRKPNIKLKMIPSRRIKRMLGRIRTKLREEARKRNGSNGEVRIRAGEEGQEGQGSSREGKVPKMREQSEW